MTIQPSVIIWTVICFLVLVFILRNLLFKPMLEIMDKRKARISNAKEKKQKREERIEKRRKENADYVRRTADEERIRIKSEAEQIRIDGKKATQSAERMRVINVENARIENENDYDKTIKRITDDIEKIAYVVADNITSK